MKQILSQFKPYLKWLIFGVVMFFLAKAIQNNWQEIAAVRIRGWGWLHLAIALMIILGAYTLAGWVWSWILRDFKQLSPLWLIRVYLKTNLAKYLPGSVWHYYGRISAVAPHVPIAIAALSVFLEPLLLIAASLLVILVSNRLSENVSLNFIPEGWQFLGLVVILSSLHPRFLNSVLQGIGKVKLPGNNSQTIPTVPAKIPHYPLVPLLGEIGFVGLRSLGLLFVFMAINPVNFSQYPLLFSVFNIASLLAFVLPTTPGGIGVFEATMVALLSPSFSTGIVISVAALFRLMTILAEVFGAGLASLAQR